MLKLLLRVRLWVKIMLFGFVLYGFYFWFKHGPLSQEALADGSQLNCNIATQFDHNRFIYTCENRKVFCVLADSGSISCVNK